MKKTLSLVCGLILASIYLSPLYAQSTGAISTGSMLSGSISTGSASTGTTIITSTVLKPAIVVTPPVPELKASYIVKYAMLQTKQQEIASMFANFANLVTSGAINKETIICLAMPRLDLSGLGTGTFGQTIIDMQTDMWYLSGRINALTGIYTSGTISYDILRTTLDTTYSQYNQIFDTYIANISKQRDDQIRIVNTLSTSYTSLIDRMRQDKKFVDDFITSYETYMSKSADSSLYYGYTLDQAYTQYTTYRDYTHTILTQNLVTKYAKYRGKYRDIIPYSGYIADLNTLTHSQIDSRFATRWSQDLGVITDTQSIAMITQTYKSLKKLYGTGNSYCGLLTTVSDDQRTQYKSYTTTLQSHITKLPARGTGIDIVQEKSRLTQRLSTSLDSLYKQTVNDLLAQYDRSLQSQIKSWKALIRDESTRLMSLQNLSSSLARAKQAQKITTTAMISRSVVKKIEAMK